MAITVIILFCFLVFLLLLSIFVDYEDKRIKVSSWRKNGKITKNTVIAAGLSGQLLKPKSSKHFIPSRPIGLKISLKMLR